MRNDHDLAVATDLIRQIERYRLDITVPYMQWTCIGAALSTLGEQGRELFHRVSCLYPRYNRRQCDAKFNNLMRTNRKINLGYFIYVCRKYGLTTTLRRSCTPQIKTAVAHRRHDIATSYHDNHLVAKTLAGYDRNRLFQYLVKTTADDDVGVWSNLFATYRVGTQKEGATVFWQHDTAQRCHAGKIIDYTDTGHRNHATPIRWVHSLLRQKNFSLVQVPFGAHLLLKHQGLVAIVESEKTALVAMYEYNPTLNPCSVLFLAVGGCSGLSAQRLECCRGRDIIVYPDRDCEEMWCHRATELTSMFRTVDVKTLPLLPYLDAKADLADFILHRYQTPI